LIAVQPGRVTAPVVWDVLSPVAFFSHLDETSLSLHCVALGSIAQTLLSAVDEDISKGCLCLFAVRFRFSIDGQLC
jgi:hypothetical protein